MYKRNRNSGYHHYGGKYKGTDTFIEYFKNLIDYIHAENSETNKLQMNHWSEEIKAIF